jgi:hypothetical protein
LHRAAVSVSVLVIYEYQDERRHEEKPKSPEESGERRESQQYRCDSSRRGASAQDCKKSSDHAKRHRPPVGGSLPNRSKLNDD